MSRSLEKSKDNAQGANNMSEKWAGIRTVTDGQLMCQYIMNDLHTITEQDPQRSTSDQVNY